MSCEQLKQIACDAIDDAAKDLHDTSQKLWENPELAYKEVFAHDILTKFLEERNFENVIRHYHTKTAFCASYGEKSDGPHIAVMCEYDALPEIGHACGHNLIAEVGLAVGIGLKAALERSNKKLGKVTVLGTPAEEEIGGKVDLINAGVYKDYDVAMMAHPSKYSLLRPNYVAINELTIEFTGEEAHAAEFPWEGKNALDAVMLCYQNISCLRQQMKPGGMVHGIVKNGGARPNIIPGKASLEYYIRSPTNTELEELDAKVTCCAQGAAIATGCKVDFTRSTHYENLMTNETMIKLYEKNGQTLGMEFERDEKIIKKFGGSTDMGNVSHVLPTIHPEFHIGSDFSSHTKGFAVAAGDETAQSYTLSTAKAMAMAAIDIYTDPTLLTKIREEFDTNLTRRNR